MKNDNFTKVLKETDEMFYQRYNTSIVGRDIESVISEDALFENYKESLLKGFEDYETLETMLENAREDILTESSMTGIQPFASLSMPALVKLWARLAMTEAIPTEPTNTPAFTVPFMKPFVMDKDGNKYFLPESINNVPENVVEKRALKPLVELTNGKVDKYDLFTDLPNVRDVDTVDRKFRIMAATWSDSVDEAGDPGQVELLSSRIVLDSSERLYGEVKYATDLDGGFEEDTILGKVDTADGTLTLTSMSGKLQSVVIEGFVSSEAHTEATQIGFDVERRDVTVGTAEHIEASFPIEFLKDTKAMYDIDGASTVVDIMSQTSAQKVDLDIIEFLQDAYEGTDALYHRTFDVYPGGDFAIQPSEWLDGLRRTIDHLVTHMKNDYKNYRSTFVIVGNPLDTQLIPNVGWTFNSTTDTINGVDVSYSVGAVSGASRYKVVSSDLVTQGSLLVFAVPSEEQFKTFVYYPYTFNVVNGSYLNTRNPNVPNIMLTRRYTMEQYAPVIGKITIKNNDGTVYSR